MKRKYLRTFYSLETASDFNRAKFSTLRDDQDEEKSEMILFHPHIYQSWGDKLMKPWTLSNWARWEEEKPNCFTDAWLDGVPNRFVPYEFRVKYKKTKGRVRRRSIEKETG